MWCERRGGDEAGAGANRCGRNTIARYLDMMHVSVFFFFFFYDIALYLDVRQQELFQELCYRIFPPE